MLTEEIQLSNAVTTRLTPGCQDRDWRLRWDQLLLRRPRVTGARTGKRGGDEIHAAAQDLLEFFVSAYHLKDALIKDGAVAKSEVEGAITESPILALLADLANLDKHRKLTRAPRSGDVPTIESVSDVSSDDSWRLRMVILHKGKQLDGASFAERAIGEWQSYLDEWGLLT